MANRSPPSSILDELECISVPSDSGDDWTVFGPSDIDPSEPDIISIDDEDKAPAPLQRDRRGDKSIIQLPDVEEKRYRFSNGINIKKGCTVELKDRSSRSADGLHSGDFLRVQYIIRNVQTDEARLRGYRLRRAKYHGQIFDWKLNELVMVLNIDANDSTHAFNQGMIDVSTTEVRRIRDCVITNRPYPLHSFRDTGGHRGLNGQSQDEAREWVFNHGRLVCRAVNILETHRNGKAYGGVVRHIYSSEADEHAKGPPSIHSEGTSPESSIPIDGDEADGSSKRCKTFMATRHARYTFGDCFCGVGGASQGAHQAGLIVHWGLDHNERAIEAYSENHRGAVPHCGDAHNFPPKGYTKEHMKVDVLHLSPPCQMWSPCHTRHGKNDQANYEAIYTVGPIIQALQPRVATLEQTFGLVTFEEHQKNFKLLMNDVVRAGYDLRYRIVDMAEFGVPQCRKRLLLIAAKRGTPLPLLPLPSHGVRKVTIAQALEPLERLGNIAMRDEHHQPATSKRMNKPPYDPRTSLVRGCITTDGGSYSNYHYSGSRKFTPRELALFQTFPLNYVFSSGKTEATKQIGNAFPCKMAEALFRIIAKTLEAFDFGLVHAEEDIQDIDEYVARKRVLEGFRYLRPTLRQRQHATQGDGYTSSVFGHFRAVKPSASVREQRIGSATSIRKNRQRREVLAEAAEASENGDLIMLN